MKNVIKRDGRKKAFNTDKIYNAIKKSVEDTYPKLSLEEINNIVDDIYKAVLTNISNEKKDNMEVEEIQNIIESTLDNIDKKIEKNYSNYRSNRTSIRDLKSNLMKSITKIGIQTDRDNANVGNNFTSKLLRIASESNKWCMLAQMPKELAKWI